MKLLVCSMGRYFQAGSAGEHLHQIGGARLRHPELLDPAQLVCGDRGRVWGGRNGPFQAAEASPFEARPLLKQGSYGKIKIHKESKLSQLMYPFEVVAALKLKFGGALKGQDLGSGAVPEGNGQLASDAKFADKMLKAVSPSFSAVIPALPNEAGNPPRLVVGVF